MLNVTATKENIKGITGAYSIQDLIFEIQASFEGTEERIIVEKRNEMKSIVFPEAVGFIAYEDYKDAAEFYVYAQEDEDGEYNIVQITTIER